MKWVLRHEPTSGWELRHEQTSELCNAAQVLSCLGDGGMGGDGDGGGGDTQFPWQQLPVGARDVSHFRSAASQVSRV